MFLIIEVRCHSTEEDMEAAEVGIKTERFNMRPALINTDLIAYATPLLDNTGCSVYFQGDASLVLNLSVEEFYEFLIRNIACRN